MLQQVITVELTCLVYFESPLFCPCRWLGVVRSHSRFSPDAIDNHHKAGCAAVMRELVRHVDTARLRTSLLRSDEKLDWILPCDTHPSAFAK